MSCQEAFFQELRERGFRLTPQREMVLAVMHPIEGLATAEEIYTRVQALSASVDISTVYRTLDLLQDFRLVASVDPGDGQRRYELVSTHGSHIHLVCSRCGQVVGADIEPARTFAASVREAYGFEADLGSLSIPGLCRACQAAPVEG